MKKQFALLIVGSLFFAQTQEAFAIPSLQLTIVGGYYDDVTETTISNGDVFTLRAYLITDGTYNDLADTYYISAALMPKTSASGNYGSFLFNGTSVQVTSDMNYGNPPLDALYPDIGGHGIFDTYYKEFSFSFNASNAIEVPNVEPGSGSGTTAGYFADFSLDTSLLAAGYQIHFDLYNQEIMTAGGSGKEKYDTYAAPFSHDAQSGDPVPEPTTMLLFGTGLIGLAGLARRKKS